VAILILEGKLTSGTTVLRAGVRLDVAEVVMVEQLLRENGELPAGWEPVEGDEGIARGGVYTLGQAVGVLLTADRADEIAETLKLGAQQWRETYAPTLVSDGPVGDERRLGDPHATVRPVHDLAPPAEIHHIEGPPVEPLQPRGDDGKFVP